MLLLVRHAPTSYTQANLIQTHENNDILPIDPECKLHFYLLLRRILHVDKIDPKSFSIHSSPKCRAISTALHLGFAPNIYNELDELNLGPYDGMQKNDFHKNMEVLNCMYEGVHHACDIETRDQIQKRIKQYISLATDYDNRYKTIIVFTHGLWIKCFIEYIAGANFKFENLFRSLVIRPMGLVKIDYNSNEEFKIGGIYNE